MIRLLLLAATASAATPYTGKMLPVRNYTITPTGKCLGNTAMLDLNGDGSADGGADSVLFNHAACLAFAVKENCEGLKNTPLSANVCVWVHGGSCDGNGLAAGVAAGDASCTNLGNATVIATANVDGDALATNATLAAAACAERVLGGNDNAAADCVWTAVSGTATDCTNQSSLTYAKVATPVTSAGVQYTMTGVSGHKAVPIGVAANADLQGGIYFTSGDMNNLGIPFVANPLADTTVTGAAVTAPVYGYFAVSTAAIVFNQWATAAPASNAVAIASPGSESVAAWGCQAAGNKAVGSGIDPTNSQIGLIDGNYITLQFHDGANDCSTASKIAPADGGLSYEKVSWQAGATLSAQNSCVQTGVSASYSFTCVVVDSTDAKAEIWYTPYSDGKCGTATTADIIKFVQGTEANFTTNGYSSCAATKGVPTTADSWAILNSPEEWDKICGWVHEGKMVAIQTQDTAANCVSDGTTAAQSTNRSVYKMFPVSKKGSATTAADLNFTGQFTETTAGKLYNIGLPFGAATAGPAILDANNGGEVTYQMWNLDGNGDVLMTTYNAVPPSQAFTPDAASAFLVGAGPAAGSSNSVTGGVSTTATAGNGNYANGWQCTTNGGANNPHMSTGYAAADSDKAVTSSDVKWITLKQGPNCTAALASVTTATGIAWKSLATHSSTTYEMVVAKQAGTPQTGCQQAGASQSYSFECSGVDIVYTQYDAQPDCTGDTAFAPVTFKTTATCQAVNSQFWWIVNSPTDWAAICPPPSTPTPTPSPSPSADPTADPTTPASPGTIAATGAALAAGAAALIL